MDAVTYVTYFAVFVEGILSFFSPCILPILPVYLSLMASTLEETGKNTSFFHKRIIFQNTFFFVLGISCVFFALALSFTALGMMIMEHHLLLMRLGGMIILFLGLLQLGVFESRWLSQEHRIKWVQADHGMTPFRSFLLGLAFSFGWTPCVGPALSSVIILSAGTQSIVKGAVLIGIYSVGFLLPFFLLAIFSQTALAFFNKHRRLVRYAVKTSGVILIILGLGLFFGFGHGVNPLSSNNSQSNQTAQQAVVDKEKPMAFNFQLKDQHGRDVRLSDYKGKVVFVNFWATWCGPCRRELPEIQKLYESMDNNKVMVITITNPGGREMDVPSIKEFAQEGGYDFPILFDDTGEVFSSYQIRSFPTTYMIDKEGRIYGMVEGALNLSMMENIIDKTIQG